MKQETINKFAAILAAAQAKAAEQNKPIAHPVTTEIKQPEQAKETLQPVTLAKMISFTIIWQEGSGKYDGKTFLTWKTANDAMSAIYKEHSGQGYLKVKINVKWENGAEITDRADCSDNGGDFSPNRETIGAYLKKQNSVMYQSNLHVGDRANLSFEDVYLTGDEIGATTNKQFLNPVNLINDIAADEFSSVTIDDLLNDNKVDYCAPCIVAMPCKQSKNELPKLTIVDYSEKAFAVIGEDTKKFADALYNLGGNFNRFLKCGAGWIFSKRHLANVKEQFAL